MMGEEQELDFYTRVHLCNNFRYYFTSLSKLLSQQWAPSKILCLMQSCSSFEAKCVCSHPEHDMRGSLIINTIWEHTCQGCVKLAAPLSRSEDFCFLIYCCYWLLLSLFYWPGQYYPILFILELSLCTLQSVYRLEQRWTSLRPPSYPDCTR